METKTQNIMSLCEQWFAAILNYESRAGYPISKRILEIGGTYKKIIATRVVGNLFLRMKSWIVALERG